MNNSAVRARGAALGVTFLALAVIVGCSPNAKVEGVVKYKGQPVEGAVVQFINKEGIVVGSGQTDASGKYKLMTPYAKDQIPHGSYKVTVSKTTPAGAINMDPKAKEAAGSGGVGKDYVKDMLNMGKQAKKSELPQQFAEEKSTTLTANVPGGPFDLDLGN